MRSYSTHRVIFFPCHTLASTCCLVKPLVKNSKTHYCALYIEGLLSLGLFISHSISTKAPRVLKCFLQNTKRILIPRKEILLFLMEVFGDVQNGNEKRKGKSKAACSSFHRWAWADQTWKETWWSSVLCTIWEHFPSRKKKKSTQLVLYRGTILISDLSTWPC